MNEPEQGNTVQNMLQHPARALVQKLANKYNCEIVHVGPRSEPSSQSFHLIRRNIVDHIYFSLVFYKSRVVFHAYFCREDIRSFSVQFLQIDRVEASGELAHLDALMAKAVEELMERAQQGNWEVVKNVPLFQRYYNEQFFTRLT